MAEGWKALIWIAIVAIDMYIVSIDFLSWVVTFLNVPWYAICSFFCGTVTHPV